MKKPNKSAKKSTAAKAKKAALQEDLVLLVPECDCQPELASFVDALESTLDRKPDKLTLKFLGIHRISADSALVICDSLESKGKDTEIITEAKSPIIDSGVLIWLAGDRRYIRPTAWLKFSGPASSRKASMRRFPWDEGEPWQLGEEDELRPGFKNPNYQTVLKLIDRHLPVKLLADRLLTPHVLDEYCLISH